MRLPHDFFQRREVFGVFQATALGRIEVVEPVSEMLLDLPAHDLHCAVHQSVLLRESLVDNGQSRRQPPFRKLPGIGSSGAVTVDLGAENLRCDVCALRFGRPAGLQLAAQRLAVGNHDRPRKRALVVVHDDLVENLQTLITAEMLKQMYQYKDHNAFARQLIEMAIDPVVAEREYVELPSEDEYSDYLTEILEVIYEDVSGDDANE